MSDQVMTEKELLSAIEVLRGPTPMLKPRVGQRLLFVDFDGVLNSERFYRTKAPGVLPLDPYAVSLLNTAVLRTRCRVVVSSSWRLGRHVTVASLQRTLDSVGFVGRVCGKTPDLGGVCDPVTKEWTKPQPRGMEVQAYLDGWKGQPIESFACVDDDEDFAHLTPRLVRTNFRDGLMPEHVERLVELLGEAR